MARFIGSTATFGTLTATHEPQERTQLKRVLDRVFFGKSKDYSVIFTEYHDPYKEPDKIYGSVDKAFKDVLDGTYTNGIGKDVIFETPSEVMSILRECIGKELPKIKIMEYDLPIIRISASDGGIIGYLHPVIVMKK